MMLTVRDIKIGALVDTGRGICRVQSISLAKGHLVRIQGGKMAVALKLVVDGTDYYLHPQAKLKVFHSN